MEQEIKIGDIVFEMKGVHYRKVVRVIEGKAHTVPYLQTFLKDEPMPVMEGMTVGNALQIILALLEIPKINQTYLMTLLQRFCVPSMTQMPITEGKVWCPTAIDYDDPYKPLIMDPTIQIKYTDEESRKLDKEIQARLVMMPIKLGTYCNEVEVKQHGAEEQKN